jgi:hypothetical protein
MEWSFYAPFFTHLADVVYDLYVTVRLDEWPCQDTAQTFFQSFHEDLERQHGVVGVGQTHVIRIENRGMDGGGFIMALHYMRTFFSPAQPPYLEILKLHTKKAYTHGPKKGWRASLVNSLMGSPQQVQTCLRMLRTSPNCGAVVCKAWFWTEQMRPLVQNYMTRWSLSLASSPETMLKRSEFVAGTMFWAKFPALCNVFLQRDLLAMFDAMPIGKPTGESDAHALERIFGNLLIEQNLSIEKTTLPEHAHLVHGLGALPKGCCRRVSPIPMELRRRENGVQGLSSSSSSSLVMVRHEPERRALLSARRTLHHCNNTNNAIKQ